MTRGKRSSTPICLSPSSAWRAACLQFQRAGPLRAATPIVVLLRRPALDRGHHGRSTTPGEDCGRPVARRGAVLRRPARGAHPGVAPFQSASRIRSIVELATTEPEVPVLLSDFDADDWSLNVANGVVNLRDGSLRPHVPTEMHSKLVPIHYNPESPAPTWEKFYGRSAWRRPGSHRLRTPLRWVQPDRRCPGATTPFGHGSGANGKSTMFGMLRQLAGDYGVQLDPELLTAGLHEHHPTGLTDLRHAAGDHDRDRSWKAARRGSGEVPYRWRSDPGPAHADGLLRVHAEPSHLAGRQPPAPRSVEPTSGSGAASPWCRSTSRSRGRSESPNCRRSSPLRPAGYSPGRFVAASIGNVRVCVSPSG